MNIELSPGVWFLLFLVFVGVYWSVMMKLNELFGIMGMLAAIGAITGVAVFVALNGLNGWEPFSFYKRKDDE